MGWFGRFWADSLWNFWKIKIWKDSFSRDLFWKEYYFKDSFWREYFLGNFSVKILSQEVHSQENILRKNNSEVIIFREIFSEGNNSQKIHSEKYPF